MSLTMDCWDFLEELQDASKGNINKSEAIEILVRWAKNERMDLWTMRGLLMENAFKWR